jgi:hypothetical protein
MTLNNNGLMFSCTIMHSLLYDTYTRRRARARYEYVHMR